VYAQPARGGAELCPVGPGAIGKTALVGQADGISGDRQRGDDVQAAAVVGGGRDVAEEVVVSQQRPPGSPVGVGGARAEEDTPVGVAVGGADDVDLPVGAGDSPHADKAPCVAGEVGPGGVQRGYAQGLPAGQAVVCPAFVEPQVPGSAVGQDVSVPVDVGDAAHLDSSVAGFARIGPGPPVAAGLLLPDAEHRGALALRAQGQREDVD